MKLELSKRDIELLTHSLDHCLATCQSKAHDKKTGCEDCDGASDLNKRLKTALKEVRA